MNKQAMTRARHFQEPGKSRLIDEHASANGEAPERHAQSGLYGGHD